MGAAASTKGYKRRNHTRAPNALNVHARLGHTRTKACVRACMGSVGITPGRATMVKHEAENQESSRGRTERVCSKRMISRNSPEQSPTGDAALHSLTAQPPAQSVSAQGPSNSICDARGCMCACVGGRLGGHRAQLVVGTDVSLCGSPLVAPHPPRCLHARSWEGPGQSLHHHHRHQCEPLLAERLHRQRLHPWMLAWTQPRTTVTHANTGNGGGGGGYSC